MVPGADAGFIVDCLSEITQQLSRKRMVVT
jgi:hypothetical protein